jgi:hypothetical protein
MMDDLNTKAPLFKKMDRLIFQQIDVFKTTPNYTTFQDFYQGLDEDQQKAFRVSVVIATFVIPLLLMSFLWWQNLSLKQEIELRSSIVNKAQEILGQNMGLRQVAPRVLSANPIDSQSMMTSRLSNLLTGIGVDLSKIQVTQFDKTEITSGILRSEAMINFNNFSTAEMTNLLNTMIARERFKIASLEVKRNQNSSLLQGQFQAVHFSAIKAPEEE